MFSFPMIKEGYKHTNRKQVIPAEWKLEASEIKAKTWKISKAAPLTVSIQKILGPKDFILIIYHAKVKF